MVCGACRTPLLAVLHLCRPDLFRLFDDRVYDVLPMGGRAGGVPGEVVIVDLDEETLAR